MEINHFLLIAPDELYAERENNNSPETAKGFFKLLQTHIKYRSENVAIHLTHNLDGIQKYLEDFALKGIVIAHINPQTLPQIQVPIHNIISKPSSQIASNYQGASYTESSEIPTPMHIAKHIQGVLQN